MEGLQILELVVFLAGVVGLDVMSMRRGFDSRYSWDSSKHEHHRAW
ncbi:MAG: hypothetical protein M3328_16870 [Chloroflexota bacterium]|nr:hypothetical protein [Chloroflexota bacterium]